MRGQKHPRNLATGTHKEHYFSSPGHAWPHLVGFELLKDACVVALPSCGRTAQVKGTALFQTRMNRTTARRATEYDAVRFSHISIRAWPAILFSSLQPRFSGFAFALVFWKHQEVSTRTPSASNSHHYCWESVVASHETWPCSLAYLRELLLCMPRKHPQLDSDLQGFAFKEHVHRSRD